VVATQARGMPAEVLVVHSATGTRVNPGPRAIRGRSALVINGSDTSGCNYGQAVLPQPCLWFLYQPFITYSREPQSGAMPFVVQWLQAVLGIPKGHVWASGVTLMNTVVLAAAARNWGRSESQSRSWSGIWSRSWSRDYSWSWSDTRSWSESWSRSQ
jgi:hypothetical protein